MKKHALVLGLLAAVTLPAFADGLYVYGDLGQSKFDDFDDTDTAAAIGVGYNLNRNFSFELGYHDLGGGVKSETIYYPGLGSVNFKSSIEVSVLQVSAIAKLPLNDSFNLFARLGYAEVYGVGAAYQLNEKMALRVEYIKFGDSDVSSATVGASYAF